MKVDRLRSLSKSLPDIPETSAAWLRLLLTLLSMGLFVYLSYELFHLSGLPGSALRVVVIPPLILAFGLWLGARYVQDLYKLPRPALAWQYLLAALFGIGSPRLIIADGQKRLPKGAFDLLDAAGGPGWLVVEQGNVVVLEPLNRPPRVCGPGRHYVHRFERIKEIMALVEHQGEIDVISAFTKDGIEVLLKGLHYRYRLLTGDGVETGLSMDNPYPFSEEAVLQMAYHRALSPAGVPDWHQEVRAVLHRAIAAYINQHTVDQFTAPGFPGGESRSELWRAVLSTSVRSQLAGRGAELTLFDAGHFEVPDKAVAEERISTWRAQRDCSAQIEQAERVGLQGLGRAEAQAELLDEMVQTLDGVEAETEIGGSLRRAIFLRTYRFLKKEREVSSG